MSLSTFFPSVIAENCSQCFAENIIKPERKLLMFLYNQQLILKGQNRLKRVSQY